MKIILKWFDSFLKLLKTDRNTFLTYILTLITIFLCIDRIAEILLMIFTGMGFAYWGPIQNTLALACPVFAFLFAFSSKFIKYSKMKLTVFYIYCIALYIIAISMFTQWLNLIAWGLFFCVPNFTEIITNFSDLVKPAFTSLALALPLLTIYPLFKALYMWINDTKNITDSIMDYGGIDLSDTKAGTGPYTCEIAICKDKDTGKIVKVPEGRRFEASLVVGVSGSGKTSMVFEPMMARDLEKKHFFTGIAKEMGYTAIRSGLADLNCPYDNEYINKNFSLNMINPNSYKQSTFKAYMNKMIYGTTSSGKIIYRDLGLTSISPDYESTSHIMEVAKNFNIAVNLIDPANPNSKGLNPFVNSNPAKTAVMISSVLKGMYATTHTDVEEAFRENITAQAIENLSILLKEMYPRLNDGDLPNLEDLLNLLNNFDLVENMCESLKKDEELKEQYRLQIGYFEKNFYKTGPGRVETERYVYSAITELDNLLRYDGVRNILCNRTDNIDFEKSLENGEVNLVCTRRGDLGATAHKAFGLFFILSMQYAILSRPGNEKTRIPHFMYIDEFPDFICKATEPIFTLYRKYRVGAIISAQNLDQFGTNANSKYRQTILANCTTKMVFGNNTPEDNEWWEKEFGEERDWIFSNSYKTDKGEYDSTYGGIKWGWKQSYKAGKVQTIKFKTCIYKTKDLKGKHTVGQGGVDFLEAKYKEPCKDKFYSFTKYTSGIQEDDNDDEPVRKKVKFNPNSVSFEGEHDVDPIITDTTDSSVFFNNDDAISINIKNNPNG